MELASILSFLALTLALGALAAAGNRLVSLVSERGLERLLATATLAAAAAVASSLALGRVGLGASPAALIAVALAALAAALRLLPAPEVRLRDELGGWWWQLGPTWQIAAGAGAGASAVWAGFALLEPSLDIDSTLFHLSEVSIWIHSGKPGSIELISSSFPIGSYPSTNEVLMTWLGGLSRNVGVVLLWPIAAAGLTLAAVGSTLRTLEASRLAVAVALLTVAGIPIFFEALTSLDTDLASAAWLAVCIALCARVATGKGHPALLAIALIAFALAVGTKTSVAPVGIVALLVAGGRTPRASLPLLGGGLLVAGVVGGIWYIRNFIQFGSPLWPFISLPGGDPLPAAFATSNVSFLQNPIETLDGRVGEYLALIGATPLLIAAVIVLPLLTRDRRLALLALLSIFSLLLWAQAPYTGEGEGLAEELFGPSTGRYLLATIVLMIGVVALAASREGAAGLLAKVLLTAAAGWGIVDLLAGGDGVPRATLLLAGPAIGAALAWLAARNPDGQRRGRLALAGVGALAWLAVTLYPQIFVDRYSNHPPIDDYLADTRALFADVTHWFADEGSYVDSERPVLFSPTLIGPLTGGRFEHEVGLIGPGSGCSWLDTGGWAVITLSDHGAPPPASCLEGDTPAISVPTIIGERIEVFEVAGR